MLKNCESCGMQTSNYSIVVDPDSDATIVRCKHCRQLSTPFKVPSGVQGP